MSVLLNTHPLPGEDFKFITPKGRMTFVAIAEKFRGKDAKPEDEGQYAVALVFPPAANLKLLRDSVNEAANIKFPKKKPTDLPIDFAKPSTSRGLRSPFLNADEKMAAAEMGVESLEGYVMIRANAYKYRPGVRNSKGEIVPVDELDIECYRGRFARGEIAVHAYDNPQNKGVKFYLQSVQLLSAGERMTGGGAPSTGVNFAAVEDEEEDALS